MNVYAPGIRRPARGHGLEVGSFYHLTGCALQGRACDGLACFVAGHRNSSTPDISRSSSPRVYCLGRCFEAPATFEERGSVLPPYIESRSRQTIALAGILQRKGPPSLAAYREAGGYRALEDAREKSGDEVIRELEISELRGRGGAGFPTGRKWRSAANQPAGEKFVIANADEGDAGAYSDRILLENDPHAVLEGLLITAHAVGATRGWIYLRSEYPAARLVLENALEELRSAGMLGKDALGTGRSFDLNLHVGGGSYVCGEETALLCSIEGRRPEVMARPPYATEHGLFGRPTVMNNVETLVNVPWIVQHGGARYRELGFSRSRGTKLVSLNSLFRRPGLYEVEFGVTIRQIVEDMGGGLRDGATLKGVIIGGPLAGIIPPQLLDTPFGFEELRTIGAGVGHGSVLAFDEQTSITSLLHHVFEFAAYESCGKCTPCRLGSRRVEQRLGGMLEGRGTEAGTKAECERIIAALKSTSLCGLGLGLAEFAESALRHYGKELDLCWR